jgi:hypothetical protein
VFAEVGQTLELTPQESNGPSLDETLKFITDKINSLKGYAYFRKGGYTQRIESTSIEISNDYIVTLKQKRVEPGSWFSGHDQMDHYECDLKSIQNASISDVTGPSVVHIYFNGQCKSYGHYMSDYPKNPPYYTQVLELDTGNPDLAKKLVKAFNHAAPLLQNLPKKRSNELF